MGDEGLCLHITSTSYNLHIRRTPCHEDQSVQEFPTIKGTTCNSKADKIADISIIIKAFTNYSLYRWIVYNLEANEPTIKH